MSKRRARSAGQAGSKQPALAEFHSARYIGGLTHAFYRYPATSSPEIVRELLLRHTRIDDLILDPFMGGGTTVVEALANGRRIVGGDLNSLAVFVTRAKTTPLTEREWDEVLSWVDEGPFRPGAIESLDLGTPTLPPYLHGPVARALSRTQFMRTSRQRTIVRCALLRTAQWALENSYLYPRRVDDRRNLRPKPNQLAAKLVSVLTDMREGMQALVEAARQRGVLKGAITERRLLVKGAAEALRPTGKLQCMRRKAQLVLTSPPYPNVHVLYHRWQIEGRRETSAPYWIAGQSDGATLSHYTMGSRTPSGQQRYFARLEQAFAAVKPFLRADGLVVQLVAFNQADDQLPRYLAAMRSAGYRACHGRGGPTLVRDVPNRRWYARGKGLDAGREYLLIHAPVS
jgi:DNA methylase